MSVLHGMCVEVIEVRRYTYILFTENIIGLLYLCYASASFRAAVSLTEVPRTLFLPIITSSKRNLHQYGYIQPLGIDVLNKNNTMHKYQFISIEFLRVPAVITAVPVSISEWHKEEQGAE